MILVIALQRTGGTSFYYDLLEQYPTHEDISESVGRFQITGEIMNTIASKPCVVKIIPWLTDYPIINQLCSTATRIIYLTRNDLEAQCKSLYKCRVSDVWEDKPVTGQYTIDKTQYIGLVKKCIDEWKELEKIYKMYPGEIVALEDRPQKPYVNNTLDSINWVGEWPDITEYVNEFKEFTKTAEALHFITTC